MRLLRVGAPGEERPAVRTEEGRLLDLSSVTSDIDGAFLAANGVDRARAAVAAGALIFPVGHIVSYLSQYMVLEPGDVINTGTPAGGALGLSGTPYLRPGDTVELSVDSLGAQRQAFGQA